MRASGVRDCHRVVTGLSPKCRYRIAARYGNRRQEPPVQPFSQSRIELAGIQPAGAGRGLGPGNPLLERVKFFCITSSNLDEFFEVRVAGLKQQMESEAVERSMDGLTATETFRAIARRVRRMVDSNTCAGTSNSPLRSPYTESGSSISTNWTEPTKRGSRNTTSPRCGRC